MSSILPRRAGAIAALLGAADTASFLAGRPQLFKDKPARAAAGVGVLLLWLAMVRSASSGGGTEARRARGVAATLAAGNAVMVGMHLKRGIASPRVFAGAALSAICLLSSLRRR